MPNSSPISSTTASGSSSQGSSTSGIGSSASSTNCASNTNYNNSTTSNSQTSNNNNNNNNNLAGSQAHSNTHHQSTGSTNLNSLSNGKLNSSSTANSNLNLNSTTSNSSSTSSSSSSNQATADNLENSSNGNLMMSNNGTTNNNSVVSQQTNSSTTNGNLNPNGNSNNQNGSTNNNNNDQSTNGSYGEQLSRTNLYIRGLSSSTTDKNLYELCSPYGKIVSTKAIIDKATNNCKGYGFVDFDSPVAAENAVKQLQINGIEAQMAKQQEQDPTNLYIANLPINMTEIDLDSMLNPFGNVISTRILKDMNQQPRGVGFARMESKEKCDLIIQNFNNKLLVGSKEPLLVKFADGGNKKKNQYKNSQGGDSRMGSGQNSVGAWRETTNGNVSGNGNSADQLSPYNYTPNNVQDHPHPNPIVAHAVAAHHAVQGHAVANSGPHQAVTAVHQMLPFPHSLMPTQSIDQSLMNQQLHFNPGSFKTPAYHPHHAHRNPTYSSAQPVTAQHTGYPGPHYQLVTGTHLPNSQQQLAMDPNALHFMPGLAAQMQQLQLGGHSYIASNPYGNASQGHINNIYTQGAPLMQQMPLSESADNHPNSTNSSVGPSDTNEINQQSYNPVYSK